ncbi:MAG: FTR1 family protein, partial [Pseudomonadota bacterium]
DIALGSLGGIGIGALTGLLLYKGLIKLHLGHALKVTGWLLILLVSGLCSQAAGYLSAAGMFSSLSKPLWNNSWLLDDSSFLGKALHSLIGYTARPSPIEIIFYAGTLILLLSLIKLTEKKHA